MKSTLLVRWVLGSGVCLGALLAVPGAIAQEESPLDPPISTAEPAPEPDPTAVVVPTETLADPSEPVVEELPAPAAEPNSLEGTTLEEPAEAPATAASPEPAIAQDTVPEDLPEAPPSPEPLPKAAPADQPAESADSAEPPVGDASENSVEGSQPTDSSADNLEDLDDLDPQALVRQQMLIEGDRLYLGGQIAEAEKRYRAAKPPFENEQEASTRTEAITDPAALSPAGRVYWREAQAGYEKGLADATMIPLSLLVEESPAFVPGQLLYAEVLQSRDRPEEALVVLERATALYPEQPDLLKAKIALLASQKKWLDASLAARQFALLNPTHPEAAAFEEAADENLQKFRSWLKRELTGNTIANVVTGALGYALTGSLFGPISAIESTALMLQGESGVGERASESIKRQVELVDDPEIVAYISELGQRFAQVAGRKDFEYEFYVVMDESLNAFALPGGKIFINLGAIAETRSEAELAGLMAHEMSHAVLSHGFQLVTSGNLTANIVQYLPLGGTIANLIVLDYSRDMERQADILGTRMLASAGYAADGMRNLMVSLATQEKGTPFPWLSSHPVSRDRVRYLEQLIQENGYNRYAYEGVERHLAMQAKAREILTARQKKTENDAQEQTNQAPDTSAPSETEPPTEGGETRNP